MRTSITISITLLATAAFTDSYPIVDIPPVYALMSQISSQNTAANLEILLEPTQSAHHFTLKPSQAAKLTEHSPLVVVGGHFSESVQEAYHNLNAEGLAYSILEDAAEDPHFWMDPIAIKDAARKLSKVMPAADLSHEMQYHFEEKLNAIDAETSKHKFDLGIIVGHAAFDRFIKKYNVPYFGALTDEDDQAAAPSDRAKMEAAIDDGKVQCLILDSAEPNPDLEDFATSNDIEFAYVDTTGWTLLDADHPNPERFFDDFFDQLALAFSQCK